MARWRLELDKFEISRIAVSAYLGTPFDGDTCLYGRRSDVSPAWPAIRSLIFAAEQALYASEGASGNPADEGIPWAVNGGEYGDWKAAFNGAPIGQLTGDLMRQLTGQSGDHLERSGPDFFLFGSDAPVGDWSGSRVWPLPSGERGHIWTTDPESEDVGGLMAQGGSVYRRYNDKMSEPVAARPPISLTDDQMDEIEETVVDYVTQADRVGTKSGLLRRQRKMPQPPHALLAGPGGEGANRIQGFGRLKRTRI